MFFLYCLIIYDFTIASFFFFNDTATTEIYTLSLHDALPISFLSASSFHFSFGIASHLSGSMPVTVTTSVLTVFLRRDRKSTRLNSSHANISYAVFCLKKKKKKSNTIQLYYP